ncbi:MAG: hypothetical protein ACRCVT_07045 [Leadbetterella sp.]
MNYTIFKGLIVFFLSAQFCLVAKPYFPRVIHPKLNAKNSKWDPSTGVFTITKSVAFTTNENDTVYFHWRIPNEIKKLVISKNVTIIGGFYVDHDIEIVGNDPFTSRIFGTNNKNWALGSDGLHNTKDDRLSYLNRNNHGAINEIAGIYGLTVILKNILIENPRIFAVTFRGTNKVIADKVHIVNSRPYPDFLSKSDGFTIGQNSIINDCYIDVCDDAVKLYFDGIKVQNTTIMHNPNGSPFALGYNGNESVSATISNVKVVLKRVDSKHPAKRSLFYFGTNNNSIDNHILIDNLDAPDYTDIKRWTNEDTTSPLPLVVMSSPNSKIKFIGVGKKSLRARAAVPFVGFSKDQVQFLDICDSGDGLSILKNEYSCAEAVGCSWK